MHAFVSASVLDYIYPYTNGSFSNYGSVGILQNPNSRFQEEGTLALSWTHNEPYLRGSIVGYPFNWAEVSYQYTDVNNALYSPFKEFSGSQSLKDKSFDLKIRLVNETIRIPQVAIGFRDLAGTGLFSSEYLVASKNVRNFDLSIGMGWGVLSGNSISNPLARISERFDSRELMEGEGGEFNTGSFFSGDAGLFGGIEYFVPKSKGLRLKLEYDGTNYKKEGRKPINQDSKINAGLVYPYSKNLSFKLSYIRGNTLSFGFSYTLGLGQKNSQYKSKEPFVPPENADVIRRVTSRSEINTYRASLKYLRDQDLHLQHATIEQDNFSVVYAQSKFRNPVISSGRTIRVLNEVLPESIKKISVSEINGGIGMFSAEIDRSIFAKALEMNDPYLLSNSIKTQDYKYLPGNYKYNPKSVYPKFFHHLGPDLRSQIGGPDGFFFGDFKLTLKSEALFSKNLSLLSVLSQGVYNNMDDLKLGSNSVLPHVRTDIVDYLKESRGFSIRRFQLNHYSQPSKDIYFKLSAGIFESMFSGYGFEALYRPFERNYGFGVEIWHAFQRDYDQMFGLRDYKTITGHATIYFKHPSTNLLFKLKGGRYLAKDSGFTFDLSRRFRSGLTLGAFFSLTDISEEEFGEGSFDKGFYFWVPVELFSPRYRSRTFGWGLRPLTRDGAQAMVHGYPLWGVTDAVSKHEYFRNLYDIFD